MTDQEYKDAIAHLMGFEDTIDEMALVKDPAKKFGKNFGEFLLVWRKASMDNFFTEERFQRVLTTIEKYIDEIVNKPAIPTGKHILAGEVIAIKHKADTQWPTWKLLIVTEHGNKLYGTRPEALAEVKRGQKVEITCRVKPSPDDAHFGFFSHVKESKIIPS